MPADQQNELNWLGEHTAVTAGRLYIAGKEAIAIINLELRYRPLRVGETGAGKVARLFRCAMPPDTAETLADQLHLCGTGGASESGDRRSLGFDMEYLSG